MNKQMVDDVHSLVDLTMQDLFMVTKNYNTETINVYFGFLENQIRIELPVAEIISYRNSIKGFFEYLREKLTEGIKEKLDERSNDL